MLSRISPNAQILLVGDPDQLPSVGPGAVLRDLLIANRIPRVHLDKVYRNEAGIAVNAARMRAGDSILSVPDCCILESNSPAGALPRLLALVTNRPDALVLTPTNDGPCGRYALNALLQPILNPGKVGTGIVQYAGSTKDPDGTVEKRQEELCLGDRVMVIRNHSELGVFNGQVGTVVDLMVPRSLDVEIDGEVIHFAGEDRRLLTLAYAITGHKAQGSEAPTVIVPVFRSRVLSREWLYTVITRARERCYLIGDVQAIQSCIKIQRSQERRTGLVEAIARTVGQ
jgi:exodeoxyribonuclease V alpha subunit